MFKLSLTKLNDFYKEVAKSKALYLPTETKGGVQFNKWVNGISMADYLNTNQSVKSLFFPQTESLAEFKLKGKIIEIKENENVQEDFVVFGVRACDARSLELLDLVFLVDPVDTFYSERRKHGIVITSACIKPQETCFCNVFDIDATNPIGDVTTWTCDNFMYFRANSKKGEVFLNSLKDLFEDADEEDKKIIKEQQNSVKEVINKLPITMNLNSFKPDNLLDLFKSPKWSELSESCLGCGTCTFVCPTCQCYDLCDFDTGHGVMRFKVWDSCMYSNFTLMAHGNIRNTQVERFRQRFMHKLVYFPANNNGIYGCVGCGRCLSKCPVSMNIVKVAKSLGVNTNG